MSASALPRILILAVATILAAAVGVVAVQAQSGSDDTATLLDVGGPGCEPYGAAETPAADSPPAVTVGGLEQCIRPGTSDAFALEAHNLEASSSYTLKLGLEVVQAGALGFDAACTVTSQTYAGGSAHSPTIHSCGTGAAAGIVSAALARSVGEGENATETEVARTDDYLVFVIPELSPERASQVRAPAKPSASANPDLPSRLGNDENTGHFWVTISGLDTTHSGTMTFSTSNRNAGFTASCSLRTASRLWHAGDASRSFGPFIIYGCGSGQVTASIQATQTSPEGETFNHRTIKSWVINRAPIVIPPTRPPVTKPTVSIGLADPAQTSVDEGTALRFVVSRSASSSRSLTVSLDVSETPSGGHLKTPVKGQAVIPAHATSVVFSLPTVDDGVDEPDGAVVVGIGSSSAYTVSSTAGSAAITVRDNDLPTVSIELADPSNPSVTEGDTLGFLVRRATSRADSLDVDLDIEELPRQGAYLVLPVPGRITIPAHATSVPFSLTTVDDRVDEPFGRVTVSIASSADYQVSATAGAAAYAVQDDDVLPSVPTGLDANGNIGSTKNVFVWWDSASHATGYEIRYSPEICVDRGSFSECAPDPAGWKSKPLSGQSTFYRPSVTGDTNTDMDKKTLYRVEVRGTSVVGNSGWSDHTFVYPTDGPPNVTGIALTPQGPPTIASGPLYGHRKNGEWNYVVCDGTIPSTFTRIGAADIERAINGWSSAAAENDRGGQLITATRVHPSKPVCKPPFVLPGPFSDLSGLRVGGRDEVMFVSREIMDTVWCFDAPGCWRSDTWRDVALKAALGAMHGLPKIKPGFVLFDESAAHWENPSYAGSPCTHIENLALHEAGHAFGIGWPLVNWSGEDLLNQHPENNVDSVMSYEARKDCKPQAYDVAAMKVNYQSR